MEQKEITKGIFVEQPQQGPETFLPNSSVSLPMLGPGVAQGIANLIFPPLTNNSGKFLQTNGTSTQWSELSGRNRIINGDMRVDQRNNGAASTATNGVFSLDRWAHEKVNAAVTTVQQVSTNIPIGFKNALKVTVTSADATVAATDFELIRQSIEGSNIVDLAFGTASAKPITLSFDVYATKTGISSIALMNSARNRSYIAEFTIGVSNTLEHKTITIPGDLAGTWVTDSGVGLTVLFPLMAGTNYQQVAGSWGIGNVIGSPNQINHLDALGNIFQITGVQLESGNVATPFEFKTYGQILNDCQRYYEPAEIMFNGYMGQYTSAITTNQFIGGFVPFKVNKRVTPSTNFNHLGGNFYWVIVNTTAFSANDITGTVVESKIDGWKLLQTRNVGNSVPVSGNIYILEAAFKIIADAEL